MSIKKKNDDKKKSKLVEILTRDYKWENLLLGILALVASVVAVFILNGTLKVDSTFPILGKGKNGIIFAAFLLVISLVGLFLVVVPFFIPAWPEVKKISWPKWSQFIENTIQVLIFVVVLSLTLLLFDYAIISIITRIRG